MEFFAIVSKKPPSPVLRAISARVTTKPSLPLPEGKKPKIQTIAIATNNEDCSIIDLEEDFNAPMFVQHTESMLEDIKKPFSQT
ncbi:hypothetical protein HanXRQr2_Chr14g0659721 [Helianthus annuus]|uniref:Uncharacterized protein n=1 Tax=Helianthus annuus TaxID=4232 RepID=A0A9K3EBG1_HELAN|nr:hypothetical protein HanXRQr2_Chr14g0659721 [Helianthus annuus]KAJ0841647.1 hypothetical protein HanPSC8_Chr14g0632811 [Helianthus annuus]